jgi:methionyl-tRNA synthetase
MRLAAGVNQYLGEQEPWKVLKTDRARAATVLYVALRCINNLKVLLAPFLPFSSQRLHEMLGAEGYLAGPLEFREYTEANGSTHRVLTGDYAGWIGRWEPQALPIGQPLRQPQALFKKLDEKVVAEELARMEGHADSASFPAPD